MYWELGSRRTTLSMPTFIPSVRADFIRFRPPLSKPSKDVHMYIGTLGGTYLCRHRLLPEFFAVPGSCRIDTHLVPQLLTTPFVACRNCRGLDLETTVLGVKFCLPFSSISRETGFATTASESVWWCTLVNVAWAATKFTCAFRPRKL